MNIILYGQLILIVNTLKAGLTGSLKKIFQSSEERAGRVFNIVRSMSLKPELLRSSLDLYSVLIQRETTSLPRWVREMIAAYVSGLQKCEYWSIGHLNDLRSEGADESLLEAIRCSDVEEAPIDNKYREVLKFAEKLTIKADQMTKEDVVNLRKHSWSDTDILEITHIVGYFNYITRVADGLGVELEESWTCNVGLFPITEKAIRFNNLYLNNVKRKNS